ncbi:MAG: hypothetical protein Q7J57_01190 [Gemmobacter sp.]|nr:hypothetical protein [Gemmobacter sp.]
MLAFNVTAACLEAELLLCGLARDIAPKGTPASANAGQPPRDTSPKGLMRMMVENSGLKVQVCAIHLPAKGAGASMLADGVTTAAPDAMGAAIVAPGISAMSF